MSLERETHPAEILPPAWVGQLTHLPAESSESHNEEFCRVMARIPGAVDLTPDDLRLQTQSAYRSIFETLGDRFHPVRFWNFLPAIHEMIDEPENRYMVFNSGRFAAFEERFGSASRFDGSVPTASAVGHAGEDLWIHCLASREKGIHFGNPRQVSPHRYSARFGYRPPCFARATLLPAKSLLLIGGTASIRGEDSLHADLRSQTAETLENLRQLISASIKTSGDPLQSLIDLRVYHPTGVDSGWLENHLRQLLPNLTELSLVDADLCRSELLVEIEGVAKATAPNGELQ